VSLYCRLMDCSTLPDGQSKSLLVQYLDVHHYLRTAEEMYMKTEKFDGIPLIRLLVYGDSGSGKTTLIGSAMDCEETSPLLVLNAGGQPISLRNYKPRPLVFTIESMMDFNFVYQWIKSGQPDPFTPKKHSDPQTMAVIGQYLKAVSAEQFRSIAIDTMTYIQRIAMREIRGWSPKPGATTVKADLLPGDLPPATTLPQWGRVLAQMTNLADLYYKNLPIHVFMTALTRRDTIESLGLTLFAPFLWGQSSLEVPSHAEIVGRIVCTATLPRKQQSGIEAAAGRASAETPYNIMFTKGGLDYIAKWQGVNDPPPLVSSPSIGKIVSILKQGR